MLIYYFFIFIDSQLSESSVDNKGKSPAKNEENEKKKTFNKSNQEKDNKRYESKNKKHSTSSSNEDIEYKNSEHNSKSRQTKKSKTSAISKMQVEHKETKKTSPKKIDISDIYEERIEKKKQNAAMYQQYLQRGGARNPGSKEIPVVCSK